MSNELLIPAVIAFLAGAAYTVIVYQISSSPRLIKTKTWVKANEQTAVILAMIPPLAAIFGSWLFVGFTSFLTATAGFCLSIIIVGGFYYLRLHNKTKE